MPSYTAQANTQCSVSPLNSSKIQNTLIISYTHGDKYITHSHSLPSTPSLSRSLPSCLNTFCPYQRSGGRDVLRTGGQYLGNQGAV